MEVSMGVCVKHPRNESIGICKYCGRKLCSECLSKKKGAYACKDENECNDYQSQQYYQKENRIREKLLEEKPKKYIDNKKNMILPLDEIKINDSIDLLNARSSKDLLTSLNEHNKDIWTDEAFEAMQRILMKRGVNISHLKCADSNDEYDVHHFKKVEAFIETHGGYKFFVTTPFHMPKCCVGCAGEAHTTVTIKSVLTTSANLSQDYIATKSLTFPFCVSCSNQMGAKGCGWEWKEPAKKSEYIKNTILSILSIKGTPFDFDIIECRISSDGDLTFTLLVHIANIQWAFEFAELNDLIDTFHFQTVELYAFGESENIPQSRSIEVFLQDEENRDKFFNRYSESSAKKRKLVRERLIGIGLSSIFMDEKWERFRLKTAKQSTYWKLSSIISSIIVIFSAGYIAIPFIEGKGNEPGSLTDSIVIILSPLFSLLAGFSVFMWIRLRGTSNKNIQVE